MSFVWVSCSMCGRTGADIPRAIRHVAAAVMKTSARAPIASQIHWNAGVDACVCRSGRSVAGKGAFPEAAGWVAECVDGSGE